MGKKVLVVYARLMGQSEEFNFGNMLIERKHPNSPLTFSEVREIEEEICSNLREHGFKVRDAIILNVIPLGD